MDGFPPQLQLKYFQVEKYQCDKTIPSLQKLYTRALAYL
jgi:hypothetical protein